MAQFVCRYRKQEQVKWISHLDVKRTLERAMRRADLPLALTQGHNPHLKLSLGPPLAVGVTGDGELFAIHLEAALPPDALKERLNAQLPTGLAVTETWVVPAYRKKETFGEIDVAEYRVAIQGGPAPDVMQSRIAALLGSPQLVVQRGGERPERSVDLRPLIVSLQLADGSNDRIELRMRLRTGSHGGARPQEIIVLLGIEEGESLVTYHRTGIYASAEAAPRGAARPGRRWAQTRGGKERR